MQNNAQWLETSPAGFKVRVKFLPMNEAEAKKCKALLENTQVIVAGVTTQGPLAIDLLFIPKTSEAVRALAHRVLDALPSAKPAAPSAADLDAKAEEQDAKEATDKKETIQ